MNGELVAHEDAKVHVLTHALHYGTGVFEGVRAYETPRGTAIFRHSDHIDRLFNSARMYYMDIPYSKEEIRAATHEVIARSGLKSCYIRPLVFRGAGPMGLYPLDCPVDVCIAVWEWGAYLGDEGKQNGVRAKVSSWRRIPHDALIPAAKATGQYLNSVLAKIESEKAGYEEGILLDSHGNVCEGTGENLFVDPRRRHRHAGLRGLDPRRHQPPVGDPDRQGPRLRGRRAQHRPRRALPRRRDLHDRHRRRADPDPRGRRPPGRHAASRARSRASCSASSRTRCTGAPSATPTGSTWCRRPRPRRDVSSIVVYDTTLRDGMQGEGMSLSVEEKLRVAHLLDDLGVHMIEAGFPASNPKEAELFALLEREGLRGAGGGVRDDAPARHRRAADDPALRGLAELLRAGLHARRQDLGPAPREGRARRPRREPAHDRGLRRLPRRRGQDRRLRRRALLRRLGRRPGLRAALPAGRRGRGRRLRDAVRHQRRHAARTRSRPPPPRSSPRSAPRSASTATTTRASASPTRSPGVRAGATMVQGTMNGYGERCGNANLVSIVPNLQLKMGHECLPSLTGLTEAAHFLDELLNFVPDPDQPYVGKNAFAHKGGLHVAGRQRRPGDVRAHRPGRGRQLARAC